MTLLPQTLMKLFAVCAMIGVRTFAFYRQDLPQAALPVFRLLTSDFGVFRPQGRHVAPIKVKFGREEGIVGPLLSAKFDLDRFRGGGLRPTKRKKIRILPI